MAEGGGKSNVIGAGGRTTTDLHMPILPRISTETPFRFSISGTKASGGRPKVARHFNAG